MRHLFTRRIDSSTSIRCLVPAFLLALVLGLLIKINTLQAALTLPEPATATLAYSELWAGKAAPDEPWFELPASEVPLPLELAPGQTMGELLVGLGLASGEVNALVQVLAKQMNMRRIQAGLPCLAYFDHDSRLAELKVQKKGEGWVQLTRSDTGWQGSWQPFQREVQVRQIEGELVDLLDTAIRQAGGPRGLAYKMANVLQWDLDFNRDLQVGDRFRVLFEEVYLDGAYSGLGSIQALAYENQGRISEGYRFGDDGSYYDAAGRPLRKLFLRSPLPFTRVTSRFSRKRFHPVLKVYRPHYGVDYGAPKGTPVRVTAKGVVLSAGWNKGGGKTVKVRHSNGYMTAYLHLSGYAKGVKSGARLRQGDLIGYVGSTGLATGPHLDYRVQANGRWIDPLSLPNVPAEPISKEEAVAFETERAMLQQRLGGEFSSADGAAKVVRKTPSPPAVERASEATDFGR